MLAGVVSAASWYCDKDAAGTNTGTSWTNAWHALAHVVFSTTPGGGVYPGDTLFISGGTDSSVYAEGLTVQYGYDDPRVTGTESNRVTIKVGKESGHNGNVVISNASGNGIYVTSEDFVTIDGAYNGTTHLIIHDCVGDGVNITGSKRSIVKYCEIYRCGDATGENGILIDVTTDPDTMVEIAYCSIHDNYQDGIHISSSRVLGYDRFIVHHNDIYNLNDDGIELGGSINFFNNTIHGVALTGTTSGHPDGIQTSGGYTRVYNNYFYNFFNYDNGFNAAMEISFFNVTHAPERYFEIYNNVCVQDQAGDSLYAGNVATTMRGLEFTRSTLTSSIADSITDVLIANNTFIGWPITGMSFALYEREGRHCVARRIKILNNVVYNCFKNPGNTIAFSIGTDLTYTSTYGSYGSGADVEIDYNIINEGPSGGKAVEVSDVTYNTNELWKAAYDVQNNVTGNPDPVINDTGMVLSGSPLINAGADLSEYFTTDRLGRVRSNWTIGAYEYTTSHTGKITIKLK